MSAHRISDLINLSNRRELSEIEQIELEDLLGDNSESDDGNGEDVVVGPIGGRNLPVLHYEMVETVDTVDAPPADDSDDSDFEGEHANNPPLLDMAEIDAVDEELENIGLEEAEVVVEEVVEGAVEANRGQRYVGQGNKDTTVWLSMPSPIETARTAASLPVVIQVFTEIAIKSILDSRLIETIVIEPNRKAKRHIAQNATSATPRRMRPWKDLTVNELYAFIGLVLHAGAEKSNLLEAQDLFAKENMAIYRATMSLERFEQISRFLRFDDTHTRPSRLRQDKLIHLDTVFGKSEFELSSFEGAVRR